MVRELYHGRRWNTDPRFRIPMVNLSCGASIFFRDVVTIEHPYLGSTKGLVTHFLYLVTIKDMLWFPYTSRKDVQMCLQRLMFWLMVLSSIGCVKVPHDPDV